MKEIKKDFISKKMSDGKRFLHFMILDMFSFEFNKLHTVQKKKINVYLISMPKKEKRNKIFTDAKFYANQSTKLKQ